MDQGHFQEELTRRRALELEARRWLGVAPTAGPEEIRQAFRRRAHELHPDRHPEDPAAAVNFQRLVAAYQLLMDGVEPSIPLSPPDKEDLDRSPGKYLETEWGYFAWWQESFMEDDPGEKEEA